VDRVAADGTVRQDLFLTAERSAGPTTTVALAGVGGARSDGGAVFDERGRFLGLGIGREDGETVAVPGASVMSVARSLVERGRVDRAWIGVEAADLPRQDALDRSLDGGAVLLTVAGEGPAAAAGLQPGDVVVAVDGRTVNGMAALADALADAGPGRTVTVTYIRDAGRADTTVTVAAAPT
jgi:S1-C subfamily serine protease